MNFSEYAKKIYPHLSGIPNQGWFIGELFTAADSAFFVKHPSYGTDDYHVKVFNGSKPFNKKMKGSFPKPIHKESLTAFFEHRIGSDSLPKLMENFGVTVEANQSKTALIEALVIQFENLITEVSDDVEDVVAKTYHDILCGIQVEPVPIPLFTGDDYNIIGDNPARHPDIGIYQEFSHTWTIKNSGSAPWNGRYFEIVNQQDIVPTAQPSRVKVPPTEPGETTTITVNFDSRGDERRIYEAIWQMKDSEGRLCFPNKEGLRLQIKVCFKLAMANKKAEG